MITVEINLSGKGGNINEEIEITSEEIKQLACDKARGKYEEGYYNNITAGEIEINAQLH